MVRSLTGCDVLELTTLSDPLAPDSAARLRYVVVVVSAELGTLNHTELTVGALRSRGIEPSGLIIGSWPPAPSLAETCNRADLPRVSVVLLVATIPAGAAALSAREFGRLASTWWE